MLEGIRMTFNSLSSLRRPSSTFTYSSVTSTSSAQTSGSLTLRRTPYLSEEWTPYIAPIQNFRDQHTSWWSYSQKKLDQWWRPQVITESSVFWPRGHCTPPSWLDGDFGSHICCGFLPMQFQWPCPGSKCDNMREQQTPKLWSPPTTAVKLLSFQISSFLSLFLLCICFFWVASIFEQYACLQTSVIHSYMFAKWIPEFFSICFHFFDHSVDHTTCENFQRKSWGLGKVCRYKSNVRAVLCPASFIKAGIRPSLVSRLPNILHETNFCLLSGQILISWLAKHPFTNTTKGFLNWEYPYSLLWNSMSTSLDQLLSGEVTSLVSEVHPGGLTLTTL